LPKKARDSHKKRKKTQKGKWTNGGTDGKALRDFSWFSWPFFLYVFSLIRYDKFLEAFHFITILQVKARTLLQRQPAPSGC